MKGSTDRRMMLLAAGAATVVAVAGSAAPAQPLAVISGTVEFEGGAVIPDGEVEIYVDDPAVRESVQRHAEGMRLRSDGGSRSMDFTFPAGTGSTGSSGAQIVARLERADGWLLARGSARFEVGSPVHITLHAVMY